MFPTPAFLLGLSTLAVTSAFAKSCPLDSPTSCKHTTAAVDSCCVEAPAGLLMQTQLWDFHPVIEPSNSWTIHGLWPDRCDGHPAKHCDSPHAKYNITSVLQHGASDVLSDMQTYWKDNKGDDEWFWNHEWSKHGACMSTLQPACFSQFVEGQDAVYYFTRVVNLFKALPTYEYLEAAGIRPSSTETYTLAQLNAAVEAGWGYTPSFQCKGKWLDAVYYYHHLKGSIVDGDLIPTNAPGAGNCNSEGIMYLPKREYHPEAHQRHHVRSGKAKNHGKSQEEHNEL
ncbi:ribonuclease T2 [Ceratobasidium sp. AG-I]|nr:ribonuclease T2 [Ceratobasidium sp. AG-I]